MGFRFRMGPTVLSGEGSLAEVAPQLAAWGASRALVVTDRALAASPVFSRVRQALPEAAVFDGVTGEPTVDQVEAAAAAARKAQAQALVAVGGGSSLDTAKLAALLAALGGNLTDYAQDWSRVHQPTLPVVAVPTTVGSGSEMTRGAVYKDPSGRQKRVVVSEHLFPRLAVLDPSLLASLPPEVVAATGSDALTQAVEGVLSTAASPFSDALHLRAIGLIRQFFGRAVARPEDREAMGAMQQAAAMVGAGLAQSGVGAAHALANTLGGRYPIPHGVACAMMLEPVLALNGTLAPERHALIAQAGFGLSVSAGEAQEAVRHATRELLHQVEADRWRLHDFGVQQEDLPDVAREAAEHSDMATSPVRPSVATLTALLREAW